MPGAANRLAQRPAIAEDIHDPRAVKEFFISPATQRRLSSSDAQPR